MENQPKTLKTYKNRHGTMKNQSGAIKTKLELYRVVMGGSSGYRRLTGGSDDFSLQTHMHHNIYILRTIFNIAIVISSNYQGYKLKTIFNALISIFTTRKVHND